MHKISSLNLSAGVQCSVQQAKINTLNQYVRYTQTKDMQVQSTQADTSFRANSLQHFVALFLLDHNIEHSDKKGNKTTFDQHCLVHSMNNTPKPNPLIQCHRNTWPSKRTRTNNSNHCATRETFGKPNKNT